MDEITGLRTARDKKQWAQTELMHGLANVLGYWTERLSSEEREILGEEGLLGMQEIMQAQADRVAKIFGYEKAWAN